MGFQLLELNGEADNFADGGERLAHRHSSARDQRIIYAIIFI
jgi:hypothetical protein